MRGILVLLVLLVGGESVAQNTYWMEAMSSPNPNFFKANESFHEYWKGKEKTKHSGYKQFERWCFAVQPYVQADGSIKNYKEVWQAAVDYHRHNPSRSANGNWLEIGPWQEKNYSRGVGRLTTMAFHPTDSNTFYIGSPSGGIWITTDNGHTWVNPKDDIMNFGVSAIVVDPKSPNIIYIGTGDSDGLDTDGTGVYKSEDGGYTWTQKNLGMSDETVTKLLIDPDSTNILFATTRTGIFKSENSANSWSKKQQSGDFRDVEFKPTTTDTLYAGQWTYPGNGGVVYVSGDKGETWNRRFILEGMFPDMRQEIEVCAAAPNNIWALGEKYFYRSETSADSFKILRNDGAFLLDRDAQGWYNASFKVDPQDPNIMYCGNVRLYKTYDGGLNWVRLNHTHADNHYIDIHPITRALYVLDDGGIHRSYDGGNTFEDLTNIGVSAIYRLSQSPFNVEHTLTGYQDCGSKYYTGRDWVSTYGADGMQPLFDASDSGIFYTSYQYGRIVRYLSHIGSAQVVEQPEDEGPWVTPFILDPKNNQTMYMGRETLWRSTNMHTQDRRDVEWKDIGGGVASNVGRYMRIKFHRYYPERMLAITQVANRSASYFMWCNDVYDSNRVWTRFSNYPNVPNLPDFETSPDDSNLIYLVVNDAFFVSTDGGKNFVNKTSNLPKVPHHVLIMDTVTRDLYLGSDAGVFVKKNGDSLWTTFNNGLGASARVRDLGIYYHPTDHKLSRLKAATYGRGLWESDLLNAGSNNVAKTYTYLKTNEGRYDYQPTFKVEVAFKRHIHTDTVSGFDQSDVVVTNGSIQSFTQVGRVYELEIRAAAKGYVYVDVPAGVATSLTTGNPTDSAETLRFDYLDDPISVGPKGPGGVGDDQALMLWLKGDNLMLDDNGDTLIADGEKVEKWFDAAKGFYAEQTTDSSKPKLRLDSNGVAGWPAVEYNPPNRFLRLENFGPVGRDITVFAVAQSNTDNWTGHSWIANSREHNGFLIHNNNNSKFAYGNVLDENRRYLGTPSVDFPVITEPHIFTISYNERKWQNHFYVDDRVGIDYLTSDHFRNENDTIAIRLGKDNRDRYGDGKLAEMIYFKEDLGQARRMIVANYLAAKYDIDLRSEDRYDEDKYWKYDVAGIGKISATDFHESAYSEGVMLSNVESAMGNGDFILWGHDKADWIWQLDYTPEYHQLKRIWHVSESGDMGTITLRVDTSRLGSVSQEVGIKVGSWIEVVSTNMGKFYTMAQVDSVYEIQLDLNDDEYFTFVTGERLNIGVEEVAVSSLKLMPNPARDGMSYVSFEAEANDNLNVFIVDVQGRTVLELQHKVQSGMNRIPVDLGSYAPGVYHIQLSGAGFNTVLKLVR